MPLGEEVVQLGNISPHSGGGDFPIAVVMNRNVTIKGVVVNSDTAPDAANTLAVKVNGSALSPAVSGQDSTTRPNFQGEFVGIGSAGAGSTTEVAKGDLIEINHDGAATVGGAVWCALVMNEGHDANEMVVQAGRVANLTTPGDYDIPVTIGEPCYLKGIMFHTKSLTDAVDVLTLKVNGTPSSVVCNGRSGIAANSGEFLGASTRLDLLPGDKVEVTNGGQSTGGAAAFCALVLGR